MARLTKQERDQFDDYLIGATLAFLRRWAGTYHKSRVLIINVPLLENGSNVRRIINLMRREGIPIISGRKGYCYTEDRQKVLQYSLALRDRTINIMAAYSGLLDYLGEENYRNITRFNFIDDGNE